MKRVRLRLVREVDVVVNSDTDEAARLEAESVLGRFYDTSKIWFSGKETQSAEAVSVEEVDAIYLPNKCEHGHEASVVVECTDCEGTFCLDHIDGYDYPLCDSCMKNYREDEETEEE